MKKTIKDFDLNNKRVIIRVDYNVPIKDGVITDDNRIVASLDTINYALNNGAKIILLSHLGRIKEESDKAKNDLKPVALALSKLINRDVKFISDTDFNKIREELDGDFDIALLQNTRYYDLDNNMESGNSEDLARFYASLGDIFINDAFGTIHRAHASNVGIASILPSGVGFLVEKELKELSYLDNPERPYTVILGGAKVSDKIKVIENLATKCDYLVIGGAMANTFLKAKGYNIGASLVEDDYLDFASNMLELYKDKIILPADVVVSKEMSDKEFYNKSIDSLDNDDIILDLGSNTQSLIEEKLSSTKTVMWNGPLGYYELETYQKATSNIMNYLVNNDIRTVLGGGDIVACSSELGLKEKVYHASTGGGATLEYLEGKSLPGIEVIQEI